MTSSEIKKKAKRLLHKQYGQWSTLVMIPFIFVAIYFFLVMVISTTASIYSSYDYYDDRDVYRSWQDDGQGNTTGDYWDGYDDGWDEGYDQGWDDGWDDGWDAAYYEDEDYYYEDDDEHNLHVAVNAPAEAMPMNSLHDSYYYSRSNGGAGWSVFFWYLFGLLISAISLLYQGMIKWAAVDNTEGEPFSLKITFGKFFKENRNRAVAANLLVWLYTVLWSLLFVIPGIVKQVSYSMTNYLLRKDEKLTANEAIALSTELMKGYKMEYFMFTLSFVLWYISSFFSMGISLFHVIPYFSVSEALFFDQVIAEKHHLFSHELESGFTDF